MKTITFRTPVQRALFICELSGQISDGNWENAEPGTHWEDMCDATVLCGDEVGVRGFKPKRTYQFGDPELLEIVGQRMLGYARLTLEDFSTTAVEDIETALLNLDGKFAPTDAKEILETVSGPCKYWERAAVKAAQLPQEHIRRAIESDAKYTMQDMIADLNEMSEVIRNARRFN